MRVIICDDDEYIRQRLHDNIRLAFKSMRKAVIRDCWNVTNMTTEKIC